MNRKTNGSNGYSPAPVVADEMIRSSDRSVLMREYLREADRRFRNRTRTIPHGIDDATAWVQAERAIEDAQDIEDSELRWQIVDSACSLQERLLTASKLRRTIAVAHEAAEKANALRALSETGKVTVREQLRAVDRQLVSNAVLLPELEPSDRAEFQDRIQEARAALAQAFQVLR